MNPSLILAGLGFVAAASALAAGPLAAGESLDAHRWKSRLLVAVAPRADDPRLAEQTRIWQDAQQGSRERDLVLVAEGGRSARADELRRRFGIPPAEFRAILVGKDGGAKLADGRPLAADRLFAEIDTMPMRRDEMRRGPPGETRR